MINRADVLAFLDGQTSHYETLYHSAVNYEVQAEERDQEAARALVARERARWRVMQTVRHEFITRFPASEEGQ